MSNVWTHGIWTVKPGHADEFVTLWRRMAHEGTAAFATIEPPTLLRDRDRPDEFISFGPWPDVEEVDRFRASPTFEAAQERMHELLDSFVTRTLDEISRGD